MNFPKRIEGYSFRCAGDVLSRAVMTEPDSRCGVPVVVIGARELADIEARLKNAEEDFLRFKSRCNALECRLIYSRREPGKLLHAIVATGATGATNLYDWDRLSDFARERFAELEKELFEKLTAPQKAGVGDVGADKGRSAA